MSYNPTMNSKLAVIGPNKQFEEIKKVDENGVEYWEARELMPLLEYTDWRNFTGVITKAQEACKNSNQSIENHFVGINKMIKIAVGTAKETTRLIQDYKLSRYACYLIAQNGDSSKEAIARAQTYFAVQARRQEISDQLEEGEKRLFIRSEVSEQNKKLFGTAKTAGVSRFGLFNDAGYRGLYGKSLAEIERDKGIKKGELLDRAGSAKLAANLFRITQTDEKLRKDHIQGEREATNTHNMVGGKVRQTIKAIGGVLPEDLSPEKHIKELIKELKQLGAREEKRIASGEHDKVGLNKPLIIRIPKGITVIILSKLNKLLKNNPGTTQVILEIPQDEGVKTLSLPNSVKVTKNLVDNIREILLYLE